MESKNINQLCEKLTDELNSENFTKIFEQTEFLIKKKEQLDMSQLLKPSELTSSCITQIIADDNLYQVLQSHFSYCLNKCLEDTLSGFSPGSKQTKALICVVQQLNCPHDDHSQKLLTAFFLPKYMALEYCRQILVQLSITYSGHIEKCLLVLPQFAAVNTASAQLTKDLQNQNPALVQHVLQQMFKIKSLAQFKELSPLFAKMPEVFTQHIASATQSRSPAMRRNAAFALGEFFPTSEAEVEIRSEVSGLLVLLMDPVPAVRAQAAQSVGLIIEKFKFSVPGIQALFDQMVSLCFDSAANVARQALDALVQMFSDGETRRAAAKTVSQNFGAFYELFWAPRRTRAIATRLFGLVQQEMPLEPQMSALVMRQLNELRDPTAMFQNGLKTFGDSPQFCYEQVYVGCQLCRDFTETSLQQCIDQIGLEHILVSQARKEPVFEEKKEELLEYLRTASTNEELTALAALCNVVVQVITKHPDYTFLYRFVVQAVEALLVLNHGKNAPKEQIQFAIQGLLAKEFQESIIGLRKYESALFANYIIETLKEIKKRTYINEQVIQPIQTINQDLIEAISFFKVTQNGLKLITNGNKLIFASEVHNLNEDFDLIKQASETIIKDIQTQNDAIRCEIETSSDLIDNYCLLIDAIRNKADTEVIDKIIRVQKFDEKKQIMKHQLQIVADLYSLQMCQNTIMEKVKQIKLQKIDEQYRKECAIQLFRIQKDLVDDMSLIEKDPILGVLLSDQQLNENE